MNRYDKYFLAFRYSILAGAMAGTLLTIPAGEYPLFMLTALLLVLNTQLRLLIEKKKAYVILSALLDLAFAFYLSRTFSVFSVLVLLVTLADILIRLETEAFILLWTISPLYVWCVLAAAPLEKGLVYLLIYPAVVLLLMHVRKELSVRRNTEMLYDQLRNSNYDLEAAQTRLLEYTRQVEVNTKLEERNRISRELHDSIGHKLTGILMQVDAAIQLIEAGDKKGMDVLKATYGNINESIEVVRDTVRKLNPSGHAASKTSLKELASDFGEMTGINVEYTARGVPYDLFPSVETVLYRNIQEALTNSVRHGQATNVRVRMVYRPDMLEAIISDNGTGCSRIVKGFGLQGMEERLGIVGGSIEYNGTEGFTIHMKLPGREMEAWRFG